MKVLIGVRGAPDLCIGPRPTRNVDLNASEAA